MFEFIFLPRKVNELFVSVVQFLKYSYRTTYIDIFYHTLVIHKLHRNIYKNMYTFPLRNNLNLIITLSWILDNVHKTILLRLHKDKMKNNVYILHSVKNYFMVLWHLDILASWHLGILASWHSLDDMIWAS